DKEKAVKKGLEMEAEGAQIIDVGGESSRPGSGPVSLEEEFLRVIPVITGLREKSQIFISIDTTKAAVAEQALAAGADIINDISAGRFDENMFPLAAEKKVPIILMHMQGKPKTMQKNPSYSNLTAEIKDFLEERISAALESGIESEQIILDPGIGFGKNLFHNLEILRKLEFLNEFRRPLLLGVSRKSFIGEILSLPPDKRLEGTLAACIIGISKGAHILRVHDLKEVKKAVEVAEAILSYPEKDNRSLDPEEKKRLHAN
ncbi:MAG: dihydropteroate synthase, partial [Acidobacteriota bacterium]